MSKNYAELRKNIYQPLKDEGLFTWDFLYGQEYALATIHSPSISFIGEVKLATQKLGEIFTRVTNALRFASNDVFADLGLPQNTWLTVRLPIDLENATTVGRFDFAMTKQGLKMLEFNSDTPTSVVEAFHVNQRIADFFGQENPNLGCEQQLTTAFQQIAARYRDKGYTIDHVYFSATDGHIEDRGTTIYLMQQSGFQDARFVPLRKLSIGKEGIYVREKDGNERRSIDLLYRLHPLEYLSVNKDKQGFPTGEHILKLITQKKVAIINQPAAFLTQSKGLQALIWNLHEQQEFFTPEEHEIIETYLLPTYLDDVFRGIKPFVRKPLFGREGGGVSLFDNTGNLEITDEKQQYTSQRMVYQERVELETIEVPTLKGNFKGRLLWGSFLVGGEPSAIVARVDREITGDMAYYLPLGFRC